MRSLYSSRIRTASKTAAAFSLAVGQRAVKGTGGAADRLEGMELKQSGALLDGELCDPVQFVHVVEGEREDESERNAGGAQALQPGAHLVEGPGGLRMKSCDSGTPVEADGDQVAIGPQDVQPASIEQHAVGRDGRRQSCGVRGTKQFSQPAV